MNISKKDVCLLIALIGILVGVAGYYLIYSPTMEKVEVLKANNTVAKKTVDDLTQKGLLKDSYVEEIALMNSEIEAIYELFPIDVREEDAIMLAINQEKNSPMSVNSVNISPMNSKDFEEQAQANASKNTTLEEDVNTAIAGGVGQQAVDGYELGNVELVDIGPLNQRQCALSYTVAYDGLKRSVESISRQPNRMTIDSIAVSFDDSTGLLEGSTVVNMFCLPDQEGKEYIEPNISGVVLGTKNIFGTKRISELYDEASTEGTDETDAEAEAE